MGTISLLCSHCQSDALVRNAHALNGKQLYRCRACGRQSRENPTPHAYPQARREEILHASSRTQQLAWPHPHLWRFPYDCVGLDQKKVAQLPPLCTPLLAPDPEDPPSTILELDKLWSFVLKKAHDSWIWIALCRQTRQVVAYAVGDRSKKTCQRLWKAIPEEYRHGHCFTDFWVAASAAVVPDEQHFAVGKETGETARARTLEQHPAPTSGTLRAHDVILFQSGDHARSVPAPLSHRYNREQAILLK